MPGMGGYWFSPRVIASVTARTSSGSHSKSGKPWPRFTAPCSVASADMKVKMVVPTAGNLLWMGGVRGTRDVMVNAEVLNQLGTELKICPSKSLGRTELK